MALTKQQLEHIIQNPTKYPSLSQADLERVERIYNEYYRPLTESELSNTSFHLFLAPLRRLEFLTEREKLDMRSVWSYNGKKLSRKK